MAKADTKIENVRSKIDNLSKKLSGEEEKKPEKKPEFQPAPAEEIIEVQSAEISREPAQRQPVKKPVKRKTKKPKREKPTFITRLKEFFARLFSSRKK